MRASWRPAHLLLLHHPLADDLVDGGLGEGTGDDLASPPERDLAPSSHRVYERAIGAGDFAEGGSAMRIVPHLQSLRLGDTVALSQNGGLTVVGLDPPRSLVLHLPMDLSNGGPASDRSRAVLDWTWAFVLEPVDQGCRLLIRVRGEMRPSWLAPALPLLEPVHWVMERRMLKTIKQRAEATTETKSGANGATSEPTA